jgi:ribosomal protein S18 acetylase RimI-like enzyme
LNIRKVTEEEVDPLAAALTRAFLDDPVVHWLFRKESIRAERLQLLYAELLLRRLTLPHGEVYVGQELEGGCLWSPPGTWHMGPLQMARQLLVGWRVWGRDLPRTLTGLDRIGRKHPRGQHFYLALLGVVPEAQGRGLGSRLMYPVLERCDREGIPAYLEASTTRSRDLYRRHRFEIVEELRLPGDGPPLWRMWRDPEDGARTADAGGRVDRH